MSLLHAAARYVLGLATAQELPGAAANALAAGLDSPSLRQLAAAQGDGRATIDRLLRSALTELRWTMPSPAEAGLLHARRVAEDIVAGRVAPYEGARQIWTEVYVQVPTLVELRPFVGLASEWEDDPAHREELARTIVEESKRLSSA